MVYTDVILPSNYKRDDTSDLLPQQLGNNWRREVINVFSCSTQLSMKFFLLINVKMPTIVGILTFMIRKKKHSRLI